MTPEALELLLAPLSAAAPCGPNPEQAGPLYLKFSALQGAYDYADNAANAVAGTGDSADNAPDAPKWPEVQKDCLKLLEQTRHLQVLVVLGMAQLRTTCLPGLADTLSLTQGVLTRYWAEVYPLPDLSESSPADQMRERASILENFAGPSSFLRLLKDTVLLSNRTVGTVTLRDLLIASNEEPAREGRATFSRDTLVQMVAEAPALVQEQVAAASSALASIAAINALFEEHCGPASGPNLLGLDALLRKLEYQLKTLLPAGEAGEKAPADKQSPAGGSTVGLGVSGAPGTIRSRADVVKMLQLLIAYYEANEPSSPLPDLLRRAERLVGKSFREVMQDLQPSVSQSLDETLGIRPQN